MLRAVLFDLDGVITDSAHYHYIAWKKIADRLGIGFDESFNEKLKGISRMESLNLLLKNGARENDFSEQEKEALAEEKNDIYRSLICGITQEDTLPGIRELLIELKDHNIRTGVCSASKNASFIIDRLKLRGYFDHIVDASRVRNAKPDSDIFAIGAYVLGVSPEEAVGIEDASSGIASIQKAGMKAVGVGTKDQMKNADLFLRSTGELSFEVLNQLVMTS